MQDSEVERPSRLWLTILIVSLVIGALVAIRFPSVWFRMGGQDEQWYSVPGWTVAWEGVPRIPYVPTDAPESVFRGADKLLFALPPLYSYAQAPFFWILPAGYGAARMASLLAGAVALAVLYRLMQQCGISKLVSVAMLPVCGAARAFYFPWQDTRPDMLCAMFGLLALSFTLQAAQRWNVKYVAAAGVCIGLGALTHPYAILFAIQVGALLLVLPREKFSVKLFACALAAVTTLAAFALWLPLILLDAESFWNQFSLNVLSRSGPGLTTRILWPWPYLPEQSRLIGERLGTYQAVLLIAVLVAGALQLLFRIFGNVPRSNSESTSDLSENTEKLPSWLPLLLILSALHLHIASLGLHPAKGYLCYPWALLVLLLALLLESLATAVRNPRFKVAAVLTSTLLLAALLLPGSGIRATQVYALHNDQMVYNRQAFCRALNEKLPDNARLLVSPEYVFEFELLGRKPVNASRLELYHDVKGLPFDYLIASTQAFDEGIPDYLNCQKAWELGDATDPLACYVEVFVPTDKTPRDKAWPRK